MDIDRSIREHLAMAAKIFDQIYCASREQDTSREELRLLVECLKSTTHALRDLVYALEDRTASEVSLNGNDVLALSGAASMSSLI
jgi:hypothetical protein